MFYNIGPWYHKMAANFPSFTNYAKFHSSNPITSCKLWKVSMSRMMMLAKSEMEAKLQLILFFNWWLLQKLLGLYYKTFCSLICCCSRVKVLVSEFFSWYILKWYTMIWFADDTIPKLYNIEKSRVGIGSSRRIIEQSRYTTILNDT